MTITDTAEELIEELPDDLDATVAEVEERLDTLVNDYNVPEDEARRSVLNGYEDEYTGEENFGGSQPSGDDPLQDIGDLTTDQDGEFMTIRGEVQRLFSLSDSQSTWIAQRGMIGDDTGTTFFTISKDVLDDNPGLELEPGKSYELQGVTGDAYDGEISVQAQSNSTVSEIDESFDPPSTSGGEDEEVDIGDLTTEHDEEWMTIRGTVQRELDLNSEGQKEWISQRGIIGDDTGTAVYTIPKDVVEDNKDFKLEVGESYEISSAVGDAYEGNIGIRATSASSVETIDTTFDPPENDTEVVGPIVDVQNGSGLIKRCPEDDCTQSVTDGRCNEHGDVDGEFDLRILAVLDTGTEIHQLSFSRAATEALTGITLEEAIETAEEEMQIESVRDNMEPMLLGKYFEIEGNNAGQYIVVNGFTRVERNDWQSEAQELISTFPERPTTNSSDEGEA